MSDDELQRLAQLMIESIRPHQSREENNYLLALCNDGHEFDLALEDALWFAIENHVPLPEEMRKATQVPLLIGNPITDHIEKYFAERKS